MEILSNADDGLAIDCFANGVFYVEFFDQCFVDDD